MGCMVIVARSTVGLNKSLEVYLVGACSANSFFEI